MNTTTPYGSPSERSASGNFSPNLLDYIALILTIIGGINWGLVGAFDFNLVAAIFGEGTTASRIIYILVGLSALYCLSLLARFPRRASA
ncbi:MAG: hypothetical protein JWR60_3836 [Polaromonas sp.]|nr:hypothetical protein [Polaromonas sp.]